MCQPSLFILQKGNSYIGEENGIEMTCEHLCDAFMDYIKCLDDLVDRHCGQYWKLMEEKKQAAVPDAKKAGCGPKIFSWTG